MFNINHRVNLSSICVILNLLVVLNYYVFIAFCRPDLLLLDGEYHLYLSFP